MKKINLKSADGRRLFSFWAKTLTGLLLLSLALPLFAQETAPPAENPPLLFKDREGDFVMYRVDSFANTAYVGLCALGGNELLLRLYVPATKTEVLLSQTFYYETEASGRTQVDPGALRLYRGDFTATEESRRFLPLVYNLMNVSLSQRTRFDREPSFSFALDAARPEDEVYLFEYWLPVLGLAGVAYQSGGNISMVTAGAVSSMEDQAFFGFTGELEPLSGPEVKITPTAVSTVKAGSFEVLLDTNWETTDNLVWRIKKSTVQDAYFMVEDLDLNQLGELDAFDMIRFILLYSEGSLLMPDVRIFNYDGIPALFYRVYDLETRQITVQFKLFVAYENNWLSIVSLGAFESVYNANKEYFDNILF